MKLIDLLVQELPKRGGWPVGAAICERYLHKGNIDFYDEEGNWPEDCGKKYGYGFASAIIQHKEPCASPTTEVVTREQYEAALAASQQPAWNGEGLPPVGVTCEHCPGGTTQTEWEVVTVLGISERPGGVFIDYWLRKEDGSSYIIGNPYRFRPMRTEAERKREEVSKIIESIFYTEVTDGNYLRGMGVYDAIAAGKIAGVKLEVSDE